MANPSRRHQPRTKQLFVEIFERRDLLSATHSLLDPLFSSSLSSVLLSLQTGDSTPPAPTTGDQPSGSTTDTTSTVQGTTDLADGPTGPKAGSPTPGSTPKPGPADPIVLLKDIAITKDPLHLAPTHAPGKPGPAHPIKVVNDRNDTPSPKPKAATDNTSAQQDGTTSDTADQGSANQAAAADAGDETASDAQTAALDAVESYVTDPANDSERTGVYSIPSDDPVIASSVVSVTPGASNSLSPNVPTNSVAVSSVPSNGKVVGVGDTAGRASVRATAADVRPAFVHDLYFSNALDTSRVRTDFDTTLNRSSADISNLFLSKPRSAESLADFDRIGLLSDRLGRLERALSDNDWPLPATSRRDYRLELLAIEVAFGDAARLLEDNSGGGDEGNGEEVVASPVSGLTRAQDCSTAPCSSTWIPWRGKHRSSSAKSSKWARTWLGSWAARISFPDLSRSGWPPVPSRLREGESSEPLMASSYKAAGRQRSRAILGSAGRGLGKKSESGP